MKKLLISCATVALMSNAAVAGVHHEEKCTARTVQYQEEVTVQDPSYDNNDQWYVAGSLIANRQMDTVVRGTRFAADVDTKGIGPGFAVAVGKEYGPKWRMEAELAYRRNGLDEFQVIANNGAYNLGDLEMSGGRTTSFSLLGNLYRDFKIADDMEFYLGAGIGMARIGYRNYNAGGRQLLKDYDDTPAGQLIAGFNRHIGENTSFDFSYRYFHAARNRVELKKGIEAEPLYRAHSLFATLRYTFGERQTTPEPRTVMEPRERTEQDCVTIVHDPDPFLVLFDFDSAALTADAKSTIRNAVEAFNEFGMASINVVGHTDSSGSNTYNARLSAARADAVRDYLASLGIDGSAVSTESKGESEPLIATGDGVREPQNRRAEIVLQR